MFYKILINNADSSGIVLIGVNNPHITIQDVLQDYIVCTDVSDEVEIKWRSKDIRRGYSYACDVNEFLEAVPHLRNINVKSILI